MPYKLKKNAPAFDVVDGPLTGKRYRHGEVYAEIPEGADAKRFEEIKQAKAKVEAKDKAVKK